MPTLEEFKSSDWFKERPQIIQELICKFPYASSVKIKTTGQSAYIYSWFEDNTLSVVINVEENKHLSNALLDNYRVFGIKPEDLEFICENPELFIDIEGED